MVTNNSAKKRNLEHFSHKVFFRTLFLKLPLVNEKRTFINVLF